MRLLTRFSSDFAPSRRILNFLLVASVYLGAAQAFAYGATRIHWDFDVIWRSSGYIALITVIATCIMLLVARDRRGDIYEARMMARILVVLLLLACPYDVLFVEDTPFASSFASSPIRCATTPTSIGIIRRDTAISAAFR